MSKKKAILMGVILFMPIILTVVWIINSKPPKKLKPYEPNKQLIFYIEDTTGTVEFDDRIALRYTDDEGIIHEIRNPINYGK